MLPLRPSGLGLRSQHSSHHMCNFSLVDKWQRQVGFPRRVSIAKVLSFSGFDSGSRFTISIYKACVTFRSFMWGWLISELMLHSESFIALIRWSGKLSTTYALYDWTFSFPWFQSSAVITWSFRLHTAKERLIELPGLRLHQPRSLRRFEDIERFCQMSAGWRSMSD